MLAYGDGSDTLWRSFDVINLEENHRQGEDKTYAEMLNRIRFGKQSNDDLKVLESRVRPEGHSDLEGAMLISPRKVKVARFNEKCINKLTGKLYKSKAIHIQAMSKNFKPSINDSGCIGPTQFVDIIHLKISARVMLIYNVDVSDLLCNGATGRVIGIEENQKGIVIAVVVKFDNPKAGEESRKQNPAMALKYPEGTVIKKIEYEYSLAKKGGLVSSTAKLIQHPLILAWAVTAHKFQGATVEYPRTIVIDLRPITKENASMAYVMESRVQRLEQLYILEKLINDKMFAHARALTEYDRLMEVSMNNNPTEWEKETGGIKLFFLNYRSLKNKFTNVKNYTMIQKADLIVLTETWLEKSECSTEEYELQNYKSNLINVGKGRGIASYYKQEFLHVKNINCEGFSLTKFESDKLDVIGVYRSQEGNVTRLITELKLLMKEEKLTVIGGDMNICLLAHPRNYVTQSLLEIGFKQLVSKATHIEGGLLDHVYLYKGETRKVSHIIEYFPKYYSDHDGIGLVLTEME